MWERTEELEKVRMGTLSADYSTLATRVFVLFRLRRLYCLLPFCMRNGFLHELQFRSLLLEVSSCLSPPSSAVPSTWRPIHFSYLKALPVMETPPSERATSDRGNPGDTSRFRFCGALHSSGRKAPPRRKQDQQIVPSLPRMALALGRLFLD